MRQLVLDGMPLRMLGKSGHWIIRSLHLYTASGRWFNETSGRRGRLNGSSMRSLIESQYSALSSPRETGCQLCPEAAIQNQRMQDLYERYEHFMRKANAHARDYEQFMRAAKTYSRPPRNAVEPNSSIRSRSLSRDQ